MKMITNVEMLGILVRDARKQQGLTQDDLAGLTQTGRRFISDLENGKDTVQLGKTLDVLGNLGIALTVVHDWK